MKLKSIIVFVCAALFISITSSLATWQLTKPEETVAHTKEETIAEYYKAEVATSVSPHTLRLEMDKANTSFVVVDLRAKAAYAQGHITGAINIDASIDNKEEIVQQFKNIPEGKVVVTYCYTSACMLSRQIGNLLAENGVYVKHLTIGWVQWKYEWKSWNSPNEWNTNPEDYITVGEQPGTVVKRTENLSSCTNTEAELGC